MDDHEAATADVPGTRIGHRHRQAGGDRGIDGVAAALEHIGADLCRDPLLCHHHAVLGRHGMSLMRVWKRLRALTLILGAGRYVEEKHQRKG